MSICESRYGPHAGRVLWLATTNGLSCFDPATEQFTHFAHDPRNPQSLGYNEILCLKQDRRGRIWIGTGGGLNQLVLPTPASLDKNPTENRGNDAGATFVHYTEKNGLPNNFINGILEDEAGNLWLSTNKGLSRFNPDAGVFRNFGVSDGLQSDEFNRAAYYQCRHGEMFFGGINGLNMFFPTALKDNPHLPPVVITDFKLFNKPVGLATNEESPLKKVIAATGEIRLSHKDNVFSFEFAALEYTAPDKNQYAYKMEGFDRDWMRIGAKREAVYTNLAPGKYTFRVKASNNDGRWNEAGASLKITITPPWWQTWWFQMGSILAIRGLIISGHRLRTAYIKARNRALEQEVAERQQAEMKFRGVLESAPDAMLVTNERGNILLINTQAEKLFGYSREELIGMGVETLVPLSLRDQHAQHRQDFHQNMSQRPMGPGCDLAVLRKDDSEIPVEITLSPLETREGIWVIAAVRDISDRKKNIDALRQSREQLRALTGHLHEVMERERLSISQDIHDELGGVFTALKIDLTLLERGLEKTSAPKDDDPSLKEIRAMKQTIDATIGKMREFVRRLRPEVLDDLGLVAALEWQMQEFHKRIGVDYEFKSEAVALAVEENCAIAVFRIFQEALTNSTRHANADKIVVQIAQNQDHALIKIIDNGIGIPAEKLAAPDTFGLLGMRERALMFGGEVEITSAPGEGTTVAIKVPLAR